MACCILRQAFLGFVGNSLFDTIFHLWYTNSEIATEKPVMVQLRFFLLILTILGSGAASALWAQAPPRPAPAQPAQQPRFIPQTVDQGAAPEVEEYEPKMVVIQLNPALKPEKFNAWDSRFDAYTFTVPLKPSDVMNRLEEIAFGEELIEAADCFVPLAKLVFKDYTYLISPNCAGVVKYKNSAPYTCSRETMENDFFYTETIIRYLERLQNTLFRKELLVQYERMAPPAISSLGAIEQVNTQQVQNSVQETNQELEQEAAQSLQPRTEDLEDNTIENANFTDVQPTANPLGDDIGDDIFGEAENLED